MLTYRVDMTEFRRKVNLTWNSLRRDVEDGVERAIEHGASKAKEGEWKDRTGALRMSIVSKPIGWKGNTYWGQFNTGVPYAVYVEYPTKPHWIEPLASYAFNGQKRRPRGPGTESVVGRGYALRWKDEGGTEYFARNVWHPGTVGFHFMQHAADSTRYFLINTLHHNFPQTRAVWMH